MLNYRHLYYFWMVAKEGGLARAAERLDMAIQTISVQVRALEKSLGRQLLKPAGRTLVLTEAGQQVFARAEAIFQLGQRLEEEISQPETAAGASVRLAVGLSDGISKLAAHSLLRPLLATAGLRLLCHEGEFEQLQSELAQHHLDVVLAGQAAPSNPNLRLSSERLVSSPIDWYGPTHLVQACAQVAFPAVLQQLPVLLPTAHSVLRASLDRWLEEQGLRPQVVGEFEDSALMSVFAAGGLGVFPVSRLGADDLGLMPGLVLLGRCQDLHEEIHATYGRRGQHHPLVQKLLGRRGQMETGPHSRLD